MKPRKRLTRKQRADLFELHKGICWRCELPIDPAKEAWHAGHVDKAHWLGGDTLAPEHYSCNMDDARVQKTLAAKADRIRANHLRIPKSSRHKPIPGSKRSGYKRTFPTLDHPYGQTVKR